MPLFAELDNDNRVLRVLVSVSKAWLESRMGGRWVYEIEYVY